MPSKMLLDKNGGPHIKYNKDGRKTLLTNKPAVIEQRFLKRLRAGIQTKYLGPFLLIPYIQHLRLEHLLPLLGLEKESGIPIIKDLLLAINQTIIGKPRFSKLKTMKDLGLAIASGLPAYPDQSHYNGFLGKPKMSAVDQFIRAIGRRQFEIGYLEGDELACDTHLAIYNGKIAVQKDKVPQDGRIHKSIRIHSVVDQGYRNPVYFCCSYPGNRAVKVGQKLVDASIDILPNDKKTKFIFDKWFSVGELLDYIQTKGQQFVTLIRRHKNRIKQMEEIPLSQFKSLTKEMGITKIKVRLRNYQDEARLVVIELYENGERKLLGYLSNDFESENIEIVDYYSGRWDVEFFYEEMEYLGLSALPSIELNKVLFNLAIKLLAYNVVSAFRTNLGEDFIEHNVETIYDLFFEHQAIIKLKKNEILITIYDHPFDYELETMYYDLSKKLENKNIEPKVSWLGSYPLKFNFK